MIFWGARKVFADNENLDTFLQNFWRNSNTFGHNMFQLPWLSGRGVSPNVLIKIAFGHVSGREEQQPFEIISGKFTDAMRLEDEELYEQGFLTVIHEEHATNIYTHFTVINSDLTTRNILDGRPN